MLQELRFVIVGEALTHKNREGSKHEGQRIRPTIGDFGGNYASNQSPFNNERIKEWDEEKKKDRMPMEICPIKGYKVCRIPVTIEKSYKVEVLCIVNDIDECHILLGRPWYSQLPKPEVKVEENAIKVEVVDEHVEKIHDLHSYKEHDDKILTLLFQTTNKVDTLKTCEKIMVFNNDEDVKGFNCELKTDFECVHNLNVRDLDYGRVKKYKGFQVDVKCKSIEDKVRREKVFEVDEALDTENSRASSFQVKGIHVDETKVNEENVCYMIIDGGSCENLVSNKALDKAFKLSTKPHPIPYQIVRIKKGLTLKVTEICRVPLAMRKHYNELVTCDAVDMDTCHVLLRRPWKHDVDSTHQGVVSPKKNLKSKTLETLVASPKDFQAERKET
nr:transposon Ty3-I Gag-Pol polyprotein [Tanacetum cinerariifolium]